MLAVGQISDHPIRQNRAIPRESVIQIAIWTIQMIGALVWGAFCLILDFQIPPIAWVISSIAFLALGLMGPKEEVVVEPVRIEMTQEMISAEEKELAEFERFLANEVEDPDYFFIANEEAAEEMATPKMAFGKNEWLQFMGDPGKVPPLPDNIEEILAEPCPFWPNKTVSDSHLLVLLPATVTGKVLGYSYTEPLILKNLDKFSQAVGCIYGYIEEEILEHLGCVPNLKSQWALFTLLPDNSDPQLDQEWRQGTGYDNPSCLETAAVILLETMRNHEPIIETSICCSETLFSNGVAQFVSVRGCKYSGLSISLREAYTQGAAIRRFL